MVQDLSASSLSQCTQQTLLKLGASTESRSPRGVGSKPTAKQSPAASQGAGAHAQEAGLGSQSQPQQNAGIPHVDTFTTMLKPALKGGHRAVETPCM